MTFYLLAGMAIASIVLVVYALWPKTSHEETAIRRRIAGKKIATIIGGTRRKAKNSMAKRVMETVAPMAVHQSQKQDAEGMSKLRTKLSTAGYRGNNAPTTFLASKTIVAACLGAAALAYCWAKGYPLPSGAGIVMIGAGLGFLAPDLWLCSATSKRQEQIRNGLPDTLDMLVISVESGLGLDAAFQRVGNDMQNVHPTLSEEVQLVTLETQMGIPRSEALSNLSTRTGLDEVRSLVGVINQAERFGTSIKRRQRAEERAQKTTVKLMAPLILFIFPAILVVLAGPAALKMIETLSNTPGLL